MLCFCKPAGITRENNALKLANQRARFIGYKNKLYNKYHLFHCIFPRAFHVCAEFGGQTECIMGNWKIGNYREISNRGLDVLTSLSLGQYIKAEV